MVGNFKRWEIEHHVRRPKLLWIGRSNTSTMQAVVGVSVDTAKACDRVRPPGTVVHNGLMFYC